MALLIWPSLGALLGLVMGSFLATLVLRWPQAQALTGRSRCDACGAAVRWFDLVPVLSFLWLKGRCRACGARIDRLHPAIEIGCALIGALAFVAVPGWQGLWGALLGWLLWSKGKAAFPPAPDSDLPSVLKALHVQQRFAFFAEAVQGMDADALHASFGQWVSGVRPADLDSPTQAPGVIRSDGVQLETPELVTDKLVDSQGKTMAL